MLVAHDFQDHEPLVFVVVGPPDTEIMLAMIRQKFLPGKVVLVVDGGRGQEFLGQYLTFLQGLSVADHKAAVYLCENRRCRLPITDPAQLAARLETLGQNRDIA